jgi:hypothetical protein
MGIKGRQSRLFGMPKGILPQAIAVYYMLGSTRKREWSRAIRALRVNTTMCNNDIQQESIDEAQDRLYGYFCRHLVSLCVWCHTIDSDGKRTGPNQLHAYPGFIFSVRGIWNFVTAGHALQELDDFVTAKKIVVDNCVLIDSFGDEHISNRNIPFTFAQSPKFYIFNEAAGLDFGLIALSPLYQELLKANHIVPISKSNVKQQPQIDFTGKHLMLGLPREVIKTEFIATNKGTYAKGYVAPVLISVTAITEPPENSLNTTFPRFIAKIDDPCPIDSVEGMSGGPIFGFSENYEQYWIVAIQSSWLPQQRIVFGCPVLVFATFVEEVLGDE